MTLLKVKINGVTDIVFVEDYDAFVEEVLKDDKVAECKVLFIGTFCVEPEQNEEVYQVVKENVNEAS